MTNYLSSQFLFFSLFKATTEERLSLTRLISPDAKVALDAVQLQETLCLAGGHKIANKLRGEGVSYAEMLENACSLVKVKDYPSLYQKSLIGHSYNKLDNEYQCKELKLSKRERIRIVIPHVKQLERMLLTKVAVNTYENMTAEQRAKVDAKILTLTNTIGDNAVRGLGTTATLYAVGNAGGFATYTLMSSVLSTVSMGTLGFGTYTLASSALSLLLGPVGLIAMGSYGLFKLGSPNNKKAAQAAISCALVSQRVFSEKVLIQ